jgi:hypothetical protein
VSESTMTVDERGDKVWRNSSGHCHRTDGPAIEWSNGDKAWWVNGKYHRVDGPAIECVNGDKMWYVNGKCLGFNNQGFWALWERLTDKDRANPTLLSYLPEKF